MLGLVIYQATSLARPRMPRYDYECEFCKKVFEVTQGFHDKPLDKCIYCDGKTRKLISNTGFVLKGKGWHVTDYPSTSRKDSFGKDKKRKLEK